MYFELSKLARSESAINKAVRNGLFPLVKKVEPSEEIRSKYAILQNKKTGKIEVIGDLRDFGGYGDYEQIIDFTDYYPHHFKSPFAAYLIPKDINVGDRVYLEDLIEDYIGSSWNQGDTYRLEGCEAIWNGKDFDIQYDPDAERIESIG